ncbi:hypothetical protein ABH931_006141 [Streptacidiphilus sp. MAP12-33]|uniref:hypothetical protein n=1 Tax=Streptacidiphilus sp. MAP12-33 TaxID=3156266 RepID=UPI00351264B6
MPHTLQITPLPSGPGIRFLLDGHDIANHIVGYTLRHRAGERPSIQVELLPHVFEAQPEDVDVELAPEVAELITRLGWTPPSIGDMA